MFKWQNSGIFPQALLLQIRLHFLARRYFAALPSTFSNAAKVPSPFLS